MKIRTSFVSNSSSSSFILIIDKDKYSLIEDTFDIFSSFISEMDENNSINEINKIEFSEILYDIEYNYKEIEKAKKLINNNCIYFEGSISRNDITYLNKMENILSELDDKNYSFIIYDC